MLKQFIKKLTEGNNLTESEMSEAMENIMTGKVSDIQIASFLTALKIKGETSEEITAAAKVMLDKATKVELSGDIILDTCGTGGDGLGTINISTAIALIAAAAGIKVAKHGNRSLTSKTGSSEVLGELGVNLELSAEKVQECIETIGIGFMFAPAHHSAMKYVMPVRKDLGVRTMFNMLGPVVNPASRTHHLMGTFSPGLVELTIEVLKGLGLKHAAVVCGDGNLDEIALSGPTKVAELINGEIKSYEIKPEDFGIKSVPVESIKGGEPAENAKILRNIFEGKEKGPFYDVVILNAGMALYIGDAAEDIAEGIEKAKELISSGKVSAKLDEFVKFTNK